MTGPLVVLAVVVVVLLAVAFWPPSLFGSPEDDAWCSRVDRDLDTFARSPAGWRQTGDTE